MKRILGRSFAFAALVSLSAGCAAMGAATDRGKLVATAAFDHRCPEQQVVIVSEQSHVTGTGQYELEVCGAQKRYKRAGTLYYDAEGGGPLGK